MSAKKKKKVEATKTCESDDWHVTGKASTASFIINQCLGLVSSFLHKSVTINDSLEISNIFQFSLFLQHLLTDAFKFP